MHLLGKHHQSFIELCLEQFAYLKDYKSNIFGTENTLQPLLKCRK